MDIFELAIMRYVATDQSTSIIPQYDLENGWAIFDFLGFHKKRNRIYIIEVTSAANVTRLAEKVKEMFDQEKHIDKLKRQLTQGNSEYNKWEILVAVFVRKEAISKFKQLTAQIEQKVLVFEIEKCVFPWDYWDRIKEHGWDDVAAFTI